MPNKTCAECGKKRKHMIYDWKTGQWFCVADFRELLKDYRASDSKTSVRARSKR